MGMAAIFKMYKKLFDSFGAQGWWPADSPFEVMVGAILTQNTNWQNVEKAILALKKQGLLEPEKLYRLPQKKLARFIRPAGYFNIKAERLKEFLNFFHQRFKGDIARMKKVPLSRLRSELLKVKGIGKETADSILLYALDKPIFVVDAYTKRVLLRHRLISSDASYDDIQKLFLEHLPRDRKLFNEFHALLVRLGKDYCLKNNPRCDVCPLGQDGVLSKTTRV